LPGEFFQRVPHRSRDKVLQLRDVFCGEPIRQGVTVDSPISDEHIDNALLEPLPHLISDFMFHGVSLTEHAELME